LKADRSLQAFMLAGSEVGVGPFVEARQELGSEAGALWSRDVPVGDCRKRCDEFLVPAGIVGPDRLLHQSVRQVNGEMGRGGENHRPGAVVGRDGQVAVPQRPGIGVDIDRDVLEWYGSPFP
jgi:hypothetical protein